MAKSRVRGVQAFRKELQKLPEYLKDEVKQIVADSAEETHRLAKQNIATLDIGTSPKNFIKRKGKVYPRRILRRRYRRRISKDGLKAEIGFLGKQTRKHAYYIRFVHDGTKFVTGKPFHDRAVDQTEEPFFDECKKAIPKALKKAGM